MPILIVAVAFLLLLATVVLGTLFGAFAGWLVGLFFPGTLALVAKAIFGAAASVEPWQLGAALGFVGGFFRSSVSTSND